VLSLLHYQLVYPGQIPFHKLHLHYLLLHLHDASEEVVVAKDYCYGDGDDDDDLWQLTQNSTSPTPRTLLNARRWLVAG
jgi:hypothetical protein